MTPPTETPARPRGWWGPSLMRRTLLALLAGSSSAQADTVSVSGDPELDSRVERALDQGLAYLARELQPDGSYSGQFGTTTAIPAES